MSMVAASKPAVHEQITARRRRLILILVLLPVFVGSLDLTIVSAILPEVLTKLGIAIDTNLGLAAWAVTGYLLAYTVSMIVMGRVSDLVGRRGAFLVCLALFVFGSYWVGTAHEWPTAILNEIARRILRLRPDENMLTLLAVIIGRVIQALGAGAIVPVSLALVADMYPPENRAAPVGLVGAADTVGWVLGHLYGGLMVNFFHQHGEEIRQFLVNLGLNWPAPDWRTLFHLNIPLGVLAFILMWWALRNVEHPIGKGRFDVLGAVLISASMVLMVIGLGGSGEVSGATSFSAASKSLESATHMPFNPVLLGAGAGVFLIFLLWEWRQRDPLFELHLFRKRNVAAATIANFFVGFCLMLGLVSVPLLINLRAENATADALANAAQNAGILLSALTIPMALAAVPGARLAERIGYRNATLIGMGLAAAGFVIAGLTWRSSIPEWLMALQMIVVGVGLGLTIAPIGTVVINEVDDTRRGVASALVLIMRLLGMTFAIASLTTLALARLNYLVSLVPLPTGLTEKQMQQQNFAVYLNSGVQVISELLLVGFVVSLLALVPVLFLRSRQASVQADA